MRRVSIESLKKDYAPGVSSVKNLDKLDRELLDNRAYCKIMDSKSPVFFWGHSLSECIRQNLFAKLLVCISAFVGGDIWTRCIFATLAMLQLRDEPTARIIIGQGKSSKDIGFCWLELQVDGVWYAIDPSLIHDKRIPLSEDCLDFAMEQSNPCTRIFVIDHAEFWDEKLAQRLHVLTRSRKTSQLWYELDCESWQAPGNTAKLQEVLDEKNNASVAEVCYGIVADGDLTFTINQGLIDLCMTAQYAPEELVSIVAFADALEEILRELGFGNYE